MPQVRFRAGRSDVDVTQGLYCPACERPGAERIDLGYIADDGTTGSVAGVGHRECGYIGADPDAEEIPTGRVDLQGKTARAWFFAGLRAAGCPPRPRRNRRRIHESGGACRPRSGRPALER